MKYLLSLFLLCSLLLGAGCNKKQDSKISIESQDCNKAENIFACFLDKATHAKNPNLCNDVGSKRLTCYTAYAELLEEEVDCSLLEDPTFQYECQEHVSSQNSQVKLPKSTSTVPDTDGSLMDN